VNGQEMPIGPADISQGKLTTSFTPFQLHTYAVKLAPAKSKIAAPRSQPVQLSYDVSVTTPVGKPSLGCFDCSLDDPAADGQGHALPMEMLPGTIDFVGVRFSLAPSTSKNNAVTAHGQSIQLPAGNFRTVYLLAAAASGEQNGTFHIGDKAVPLTFQEWTGYIGQWDNRGWSTHEEPLSARPGSPAERAGTAPRTRTVTDFNGKITPGFIKRADLGWYASHRHDASGSNEAYSYSYLFVYPIEIPAGVKTLTLPKNEKMRILAVSVSDEPTDVHPVQPLYDVIGSGRTETANPR
jgi:alpha-mannosidase